MTPHKLFPTIYVMSLVAFGLLFSRHLAVVGQDYVLENWPSYFMIWVGGTCYWLMFYFFALAINEIGRMLQD
jgi:hypothetical protein